LYAHLRLADLAFPAAQAEPHLLNAQSLAHTLELPHLRYRVNQRLGHLRLSQGRFDEAQAFLELAITDIERLRGSLTHELVRSSFLRDKVAAYEDLVFLYLTRGGEDDMLNAFEVAERAKSRALVEAISTGDQLNPAPDTASTLQPQIVAAQTQLNAIYNEMLGNAGGRDGNTLLASLHSRAQELEQEISRLRLRGVASTTEPRTSPLVSVDADRCELPPDMMMIAFHILGDEIMAFVRKDGRLHAIRKISSVSVAQRLVQDLAVQWDRFRAGPEFTGRHMQMLERSAQRVLGELYRELLLPIFSRCPGTAEGTQLTAPQRLVIIPHGLLHQVPFHALFDGQRYVLDQFEISYAPSATVLALCQQRPIRPGNKAVVLGVEDPLLPAVTSEVRAVAGQFAEVTVLLGEQATVAELQAVAHDCDVIHLACHGLFRVDNPLFSALKLHDQWLLAADIMQWQLSGALVTLSACESGRSQVLAGDEVIGLTRAVLGAGAATLVVSLWLVQDETTAALMSMWYEQARQIGRAAALRNAQLELKAKYPHPYYWAPFVLVGQP
jgi:CHAT domain-containing protein